ncbi:hypothetical protein Salat_1659500 [Sesamum alatum]|uniref:Uncharacterized protein n=1 Tax=Sesamum alatum TaxID=300844 RepID=A0AAE1Y6K9_9LAMI|nr:hypothetical protein Salat_1659500 [Sesamum alatum]
MSKNGGFLTIEAWRQEPKRILPSFAQEDTRNPNSASVKGEHVLAEVCEEIETWKFEEQRHERIRGREEGELSFLKMHLTELIHQSNADSMLFFSSKTNTSTLIYFFYKLVIRIERIGRRNESGEICYVARK